MIANARMYAVTPAVAQAWRSLLLRVGEIAGVSWDYVEHAAPAPVAALWDRDDLGAAFMCGLPYITRAHKALAIHTAPPVILAAPVPAPARYAAQPVYFTEFVARRDAGFSDLAATFGHRLAHMLPESNSGFNAPRHHLMSLAPAGQTSLFAATAAPTTTPMAVLRAVLDGQAEVGVVDSYVLDLLRHHTPELMAPLVSLENTIASPIPLLVASPSQAPDVTQRVRQALLSAHEDAVCATAMDRLLLQRFTSAEPETYEVLAEREATANRAGFALTTSRDA
ncbi:phosphate/phosphite/phosphonate ABC transporter substrate-binding protein [Variovorax sp. HJSM1_2]|uniref:phosphate/phosphite/phosphonate ABC transporter substrate-binding protein n=1 Tax=Variovorax sp. HJSM1_2 TaxID=3366263 RepID=UPI003BE671A1